MERIKLSVSDAYFRILTPSKLGRYSNFTMNSSFFVSKKVENPEYIIFDIAHGISVAEIKPGAVKYWNPEPVLNDPNFDFYEYELEKKLILAYFWKTFQRDDIIFLNDTHIKKVNEKNDILVERAVRYHDLEFFLKTL